MYLHYLINLTTYQYLTYFNYTCTLPYLYLLPCFSSSYLRLPNMYHFYFHRRIYFHILPITSSQNLSICSPTCPVHLPVLFIYLPSCPSSTWVFHICFTFTFSPESSLYIFFLIIFSLKYYLPSLPAYLPTCYLYNFPLFLKFIFSFTSSLSLSLPTLSPQPFCHLPTHLWNVLPVLCFTYYTVSYFTFIFTPQCSLNLSKT